MSWLKSIFSRGQTEPRQLSEPQQLAVKDMIQFNDSFLLPSQLRGQMLEVSQVNTVEFEHSHEPEILLINAQGEQIFLGIEQDDQVWLNLSIKIKPEDVEQLFDLDQFADIFEEGVQAELVTQGEPPALAQWYSQRYRQAQDAEMGYFHRQDYRGSQPPDTEGSGEAFQYYRLVGNDERYSVEVEVWEDGETDVLLTLSRPVSDIRDYFPGS